MSTTVAIVAEGAARRDRDRNAWEHGHDYESPMKHNKVSPGRLSKKNSKRSSIIVGTSQRPRAEFMHLLDRVEAAGNLAPTPLQRYMAATRAVYESFGVQVFVAFLIMAAFGIEVWDTETFPEDGSVERDIIDIMDHVLTWVFVGELGINFFSTMVWPFFENPWNWFDMAVVSVSVINLFIPQVPWLGALRLVRTFRVLRVFGRFQGFRRIINALGSALVPVIDAFVIVLIMMAVFSILGVSLFRSKAPEFFGSFSNSFFTMFTITTVDGWVDVVNVAAPGVHDWGKVYFIAYIVILVWTLLPVVIAVLLDKFTETMSKDREILRRARLAVQAVETMTESALDPILRTLTDFETDEDLTQRIRLLYKTLDVEGQGSLTFDSVVSALDTLVLGLECHISEAAWNELTQNEKLCDGSGGLSIATFEHIVRSELRNYLQRDLAGELRMSEENSFSIPILSGLKLLLLRGAEDKSGPSRAGSRAGSRISSRRQSVAALSQYVDRVDALTRQLAGERTARREEAMLRDHAEQLNSELLSKIEPDRIDFSRSNRAMVMPGQVLSSGPLSVVAHGAGAGGGADVHAIRRIEEMLDSVLRGQERLEVEMSKLRRGQVEIQQAVDEIRQNQVGSDHDCCDVCMAETAKVGPTFRVGKAKMCQMCASLVAVGHGSPLMGSPLMGPH